MAARVVTKLITAAAVALAVELTDVALDRAGLSAQKNRLAGKVLRAGMKAAVSSTCGILLARAFERTTDDRAIQATGAPAD